MLCRLHYHQSLGAEKQTEVHEITGLKFTWLDGAKLGNVNESSVAKSSVHSTELICLYQIKLLTSDIPDFISFSSHRKAFLELKFRVPFLAFLKGQCKTPKMINS